MNGKIAFVKDYPFAKYVVRELVKPAGYVTNEEAVNFDTKYQGQDVKTAVYNSEYKNTPTTFEFKDTHLYRLYNTNIHEKIAEAKKRDNQMKISVDWSCEKSKNYT